MSLLRTAGRTWRTTSSLYTFPPFLSSPAAFLPAFWLGCVGHPQPHAPRSLNVVSISRCVNEGGLRRQGILVWAGMVFFFSGWWKSGTVGGREKSGSVVGQGRVGRVVGWEKSRRVDGWWKSGSIGGREKSGRVSGRERSGGSVEVLGSSVGSGLAHGKRNEWGGES
jgi:hypothetical protein